MSNVIGKPDLIVIDSVWKELNDLSKGKRGLLLGLLKSRSEMIDCLLYTSDAADDRIGVDLGGRRIIK